LGWLAAEVDVRFAEVHEHVSHGEEDGSLKESFGDDRRLGGRSLELRCFPPVKSFGRVSVRERLEVDLFSVREAKE
jgi:hypothetical protein